MWLFPRAAPGGAAGVEGERDAEPAPVPGDPAVEPARATGGAFRSGVTRNSHPHLMWETIKQLGWYSAMLDFLYHFLLKKFLVIWASFCSFWSALAAFGSSWPALAAFVCFWPFLEANFCLWGGRAFFFTIFGPFC